jgi:hypothetical protein
MYLRKLKMLGYKQGIIRSTYFTDWIESLIDGENDEMEMANAYAPKEDGWSLARSGNGVRQDGVNWNIKAARKRGEVGGWRICGRREGGK